MADFRYRTAGGHHIINQSDMAIAHGDFKAKSVTQVMSARMGAQLMLNMPGAAAGQPVRAVCAAQPARQRPRQQVGLIKAPSLGTAAMQRNG